MQIDIECRYTVGLSDIKIGEMGVTEEIMNSLEYLSTLPDVDACRGDIDPEARAGLEWINDHIHSDDAYDWQYIINDFDREG